MQRTCGISMECTTICIVSCPLPTSIAHLPCGKVGKNLVLLRGCTKTPLAQLKWANTALDSTAMVQPTAGTIQGDWWTSEVLSKASTTALPDQLFLNRKGHPLPPSSPRGTNLELKRETHWLLSGLATATLALRLS